MVQRPLNGALVSAFERWATSPLESKRLRRTAAKAVRQWSLGVIARAWEAWAETGQAQARERGTDEEEQQALDLDEAPWYDNTKELQRQRSLLHKMALRMRNARMYKAWATWDTDVNKTRKMRFAGTKVMLR